MKTKFKTLLATAAVSLAFPTSAKVTLPAFFTSGMVLQHNTVVSIPCKTTPGADVTVTLSLQSEKIELKADNEGKFTFRLEVPNASKQPFWIRFNDGETTLLNDLYSGEVWLCGGQSNMEMPVQGWGCVLNYEQEVANAAYPFIRLLQVSNTLAFSPQEDAAVNNGGWQVCSPATVANFSALAYFFGRELYKKLNVPIGLVYSAWGGTPCESWVSFETAKAVGGFESTLNMYEECNFDRDAILARDPGAEHFQKPTLEYNAMIYPLRIMPIAGAIWYQGENNVGNNVQYEPLFKGLINNWREIWGNNFPFYFVQLAGYQQPVEVQPGSQWAALRWAQQKALELDNTGMATAVDVGETDDIHPKNKQEVARRLSLLALKNTYGFDDMVDKAPELQSYSFTNRKAVLTFSAPLTVKEVALPRGFIMQTSTGSFVKGRCTLENDSTISVSGTFTGAPISVRYNWADFPNGNLYGENDLPVLPFRTDQMDGVLNSIETVKTDSNDKTVDVVTTDGVVVRRNADHSSATSGLPEGVYIVGSKKVLVK